MTGWDAVAAEGTDPEVLAGVVHRLAAVGTGAVSLLREVLERAPHLDPQEAILQVASDAQPDLSDGRDIRDAWVRRGVRVALPGDPGYPVRLVAGWPDPSAPLLIASRGDITRIDREPTVAIVGARRATGYGKGIAAWLAEACADSGVHVVSGGAVGIDATAHGAAVRNGTAVVLGCGHDVDYPRPHAQPGGLFDRVIEGGGALLSEHLPFMSPKPGVVRSRNRIVAALSDAVVVVEGTSRSGSLLTATAAADRGVPVLAVPGDVRAPGSAAPHRLLAEGAAPCTSPEDLLAALDRAPAATDRVVGRSAATALPPAVHGVLAQRWPRPVPVDELSAAVQQPAARLLASITRARIAGEIAEDPDGIRLTRAPT